MKNTRTWRFSIYPRSWITFDGIILEWDSNWETPCLRQKHPVKRKTKFLLICLDLACHSFISIPGRGNRDMHIKQQVASSVLTKKVSCEGVCERLPFWRSYYGVKRRSTTLSLLLICTTHHFVAAISLLNSSRLEFTQLFTAATTHFTKITIYKMRQIIEFCSTCSRNLSCSVSEFISF